jgi:hypothetical protein
MKYIKTYEGFWDRFKKKSNQEPEPSDEELKFELLSLIPQYEKYILKMVEIHENHYYKDNKISTNEGFINDIKGLSKRILADMNAGKSKEVIRNRVMPESYLDLIRKYEKELYGKDELGINSYEKDSDEDYMDESMFGILEDITGDLYSLVNPEYFGDSADTFKLSRRRLDSFKRNIDPSELDDSWVYKQSMDKTLSDMKDDLDNMDMSWVDDEDDNDLLPWKADSGEELSKMILKDVESHIGKEFDNFDYHDKLEGINYLEDKLMGHGVPPEVVNHFITQVKNDWL